MAAVAKIKAEARVYLARGNWGKAIAVLLILCVFPVAFVLCLEIGSLLFKTDSFAELALQASNPEDYRILLQNSFLSGRLTGYLILLGVLSAVWLLLALPLLLGAKRWQLMAFRREDPALVELFYYFSSFRLYWRSVWCAVNLTLRKLFWFVVCFAPGSALLVFFSVFLVQKEGGRLSAASGFGILGGLLLLAVGFIIYICLILRYFTARYAVVNEEDCPVSKAISISVRQMKGRRGIAFLLTVSFFFWGLLCFFILPLLYVQPYFGMSCAAYSKWVLKESAGACRESRLVPISFNSTVAE